jgi:aminoglycoside phosphotransferase (APT) family kinase protein
MGSSGPAVIDWLTASSGPPAADVARTLFLLRDGRMPRHLSTLRRGLTGLLRQRFSAAYLSAYRQRQALDLAEVAAWRLPLLVARLDEGIEDERAHVRALIEGELATAQG